jgi:hypothetical protein
VWAEQFIDVVASADGNNQHDELTVIDLIADPVVANAVPPDVAIARERCAFTRAGIIRQFLDRVFDPGQIRRLRAFEAIEESLGRA